MKTLAEQLKGAARGAVEEASDAFSRWLAVDLKVNVLGVDWIPFGEIVRRLSTAGDGLMVNTLMRVDSGLRGTLILCFDPKSAADMAGLLLSREPAAEMGVLERSALAETMNVVGCAYLNNLGRRCERSAIPGPPLVIEDLLESVVETVLAEHALTQDGSLFMDIEFAHPERSIRGRFAFFPQLDDVETEAALG